MRNKKKASVTIVAGVLLLLLYMLIFSFSEQDGEASGSLSRSVSHYSVECYNKLTGKHLTEQMMDELSAFWEHPIRKAAHFSEYAVMGILVYTILSCYVKNQKKRYLFSVLWVFVSAAADELHQYFVPGRWASIGDVLLDTCGGAVGAVLCYLVIQKIGKHKMAHNLKLCKGRQKDGI